jgi:hypothetical protein
MMPDIEGDEISEGQIEEAEQDPADPSHEENPAGEGRRPVRQYGRQ